LATHDGSVVTTPTPAALVAAAEQLPSTAL
jgi:hypothetical protein